MNDRMVKVHFWLHGICFIFLLLSINTLSTKPNSNNAVMVSPEAEHASEDVEVHNEDTDVNIESFIPTNEWQEILPGQAVPRGLHIRMNLSTGKKEAKLLDEDQENKIEEDTKEDLNQDAKYLDKDSETYLKYLNAKYKEKLKNIKSEDGKSPEELEEEKESRKNSFRSYEELKADLHDLMFNVETDQEVIKKLIVKYEDHKNDVQTQLDVLEDLEYLVHQIDNAISFIDLGGINTILKPGINSSDTSIQATVLTLIGSSAQSNPKVQIAMIEGGIMRSLLNIIQDSHSVKIKSKAVYAVSCIIRGFPFGQKTFVNTGGFDVLRRLFEVLDEKHLKLHLKVLSLVQDLILELDNSEGEKLKQLQEINVPEQLVEGKWCLAISKFLKALYIPSNIAQNVESYPDIDTLDKVVTAVKYLLPVCKHEFKDTLPIFQSLDNTYSNLLHTQSIDSLQIPTDVITIIKEIVYLLLVSKDEL